METQIISLIKDLKWRQKQIEHNTGTATKLGFTVQTKHLQEMRELYEDTVFKLEMIIDDYQKQKK
jgi:glutathione peroxidase-family protein